MSFDPALVYSYDVESHNDEENGYNGLDPNRSYITEISVATDESINGGGEVFSGAEAKILREFTLFVRSLKPGLMSGWNNGFFDIPFIDRRSNEVGHDPGFVLIPQPGLAPKYDPTPGYASAENPGGGYAALWSTAWGVPHMHFDVAQSYRRFADEQGVKWSLKPVCEAQGIDMVHEDRARLHLISAERRKAYCLSDSHGTRELTLRALGLDYTPYR